MKIFFIRPDDGTSMKVQREAAEAWGAERIIDPDRGDHDLSEIDVRPTDVIGVYQLHLLAARGQKANKRARQSLLEYMTVIFEQEATIEEVSTGRTCGDKVELLQMYDDARDRFSKRRSRGKDSGRPAVHKYDEKQSEHIITIWNDRRHKNNAERVAAVRIHYPKFNQAAWYKLASKAV